MRSLETYHVDVYATRSFGGNPAAVVLLDDSWLPDAVMQGIARENNLPETSFMLPSRDGYEIRWFSPKAEVDFCGHATVAAAFVAVEILGKWSPPQGPETSGVVRFHSPRGGPIPVAVTEAGTGAESTTYTLTLPADPVERCEIPVGAARAVGSIPVAAYRGSSTMLFLLSDYPRLRSMAPDFRVISKFPAAGLIVTAGPDTGEAPDFGCRYFAPQSGVAEDPVTAAVHATLAPFWAHRLKKPELSSAQLSPRGGLLHCSVDGEQVRVTGTARLYLQGRLFVDE